MRRAHTVEQVRAAEAELMTRLPEGTLMQRAAAGLAYAIIGHLRERGLTPYGSRILLLVGSGDNGGDALYAGARLARRGAKVEAWPMTGRAHEAGVAALRAAGGRVHKPRLGGPQPASRRAATRVSAGRNPRLDVVVDGIVGIGGKPGLREAAERVLANLEDVPVVAVDTPSGVDVDTGETPGSYVRAALTVTFGTHKICHLLDPAAQACGAVELVDIGLDAHLPEAPVQSLEAADVAALLPRPEPTAQKYTRGVVGLRVGSTTYPGAALLSVAGANTGLVGMVRYVGSAAETVKQHHPEVVGDGRAQAWVVGSGGGAGAAAELGAALDAARATAAAVVVDADALEGLTGPLGVPTLLTPHAGELAALLGRPRAEVEAQPLASARRAADEYAATVLLKGRHTVIAEPTSAGGRVRVNTTGTPWLATAGAGDVLGGLVGALLAAGLAPLDAASVGAWLHGAAATRAAQCGPITAGAVAAAIPAVVGDLPGW